MPQANSGAEVFGRYEYVALPLLYIRPMAATFDSCFGINLLRVDSIQLHMHGAVPRIGFAAIDLCRTMPSCATLPCVEERDIRVLPVADAKDFEWPDGMAERLYGVVTKLVVGQRLFDIELYLTRRRIRSTSLVLGSSDFSDATGSQWHDSFSAGPPKHRLVSACESLWTV